MNENCQLENNLKKTRSALLMSSVLNEPLACLLIWLPFILRKDCHATTWQISLLATLKPLVSILSFYWPKLADFFGFNHRKSVLISGFFSRIFFVFFPVFHSIEYILFASTCYLFFSRASVPSWMELLKLNLQPKQRQKWFSLSSMLGYAEGILLAVGFGSLFDKTFVAWRYLFALSAVLGMLSIFYQMALPNASSKSNKMQFSSLKDLFFRPLKEAFSLLVERKDFALFQLGFMACGIGIMLANVICPLFFVDLLHLSHLDYAYARYLYMGLGFILFSPIWQKGMQLFSIFGLTSKICMGFALFIVSMLLAQYHIAFLNLAFFIYGASQAGSHLIWHLSGPEFSKDEDSSGFSAVNLMMVGIRGLFGPIMGSILYLNFGPYVVFALSLIFCTAGGMIMLKERRGFRVKPEVAY